MTCQKFTLFWFNSSCVHLSLCQVLISSIMLIIDWLTCQIFTWFWFNSSCVHLSLCQVVHKFIMLINNLVDLSCVSCLLITCWRVCLFHYLCVHLVNWPHGYVFNWFFSFHLFTWICVWVLICLCVSVLLGHLFIISFIIRLSN